MIDDLKMCLRCGEEPVSLGHPCPYAREMNALDDEAINCETCCADCHGWCTDDV